MEPGELETWTVTIDGPAGPGQIDVPTHLGSEAAGRRALFTAASVGWGDLDELRVTAVERIPPG